MNEVVAGGLFALGAAVLASVLTGAFAWWHWSRTRARSELTIATTSPTRLIEIDSSVARDVVVLVRGTAVPAVYTLDARFQNTGTEPIEQGNVDVSLEGDLSVLTADIARRPSGAGARIAAEVDAGEAAFRIDFDYMNPGETILVRVLLSARPRAVTPVFRQRGVSLRVRREDDAVVPGVLGRTVLDAIRGIWFLHLVLLTLPPYRRYLAELDRERRSA